MLGPDQLGHVVDVAHDDFGRRRAGAEEQADAVDPDDAAGGGAGPDQLVRDVARMVAQRARVGVREDHGPVGRVEDLARRAVPGVGTALDHADPIHLREDRAAEVGEPFVLGIVAAAAGEVPPVVDEQHPAHADLMQELDQRHLGAQRLDAFHVHAHGEAPARPGRAQVGRRRAEQVLGPGSP